MNHFIRQRLPSNGPAGPWWDWKTGLDGHTSTCVQSRLAMCIKFGSEHVEKYEKILKNSIIISFWAIAVYLVIYWMTPSCEEHHCCENMHRNILIYIKDDELQKKIVLLLKELQYY